MRSYCTLCPGCAPFPRPSVQVAGHAELWVGATMHPRLVRVLPLETLLEDSASQGRLLNSALGCFSRSIWMIFPYLLARKQACEAKMTLETVASLITTWLQAHHVWCCLPCYLVCCHLYTVSMQRLQLRIVFLGVMCRHGLTLATAYTFPSISWGADHNLKQLESQQAAAQKRRAKYGFLP